MAAVISSLWMCKADGALQILTASDPAQGPPAGGGGDSWVPIVTPDARFVLFSSTANNLVMVAGNRPMPTINPASLNAFLRDRTNGTTALVSINLSGAGGGNDDSWPIGISTNGRYVLFESRATNLVLKDANQVTDVFLRDTVSNTTVLVSISTNGTAGNGTSAGSAITPDGRYIAFLSGANDLVADDTNGTPDVFVRDMESGVSRLVSVAAMGGAPYATPTDSAPEISADGRYVVFHSTATNLVPGVRTRDDIYIRDLVIGTTAQVSTGARGAVYSAFGTSNVFCFNYSLSADGRFVAYEASPVFDVTGVVLRYDVQSGTTDLVSTNAVAASIAESRSLDMTPDGRFIAFVANANDGNDSSILVWDAQNGRTTLASGDANNLVPTNSICDWPTLTADGGFVAFLSSAQTLVTNSLLGEEHLYVRDLQGHKTTLVDVNTNGVGSLLTSRPIPALSADGRFVAFEAPDGGLVPLDHNFSYDVFVRDVTAHTTELISARAQALPSLSPNGPSLLSPLSTSADGRYLVFASEANDIVANDTNGFRDVFVRRLPDGPTVQVSVAPDGITPGDHISYEPTISADGRYVAFTSSANNLVTGDTNKTEDVFVRDLQTINTVLVSVKANGTGPGNNNSHWGTISSDGRYVLFASRASNLVPGSFSGENLFFRDLQGGTTYALSTNNVTAWAMTPDGHYVAFVGGISSPGVPALYVWESQTATRIYTNASPTISTIAISPNGQWLVYSTFNGLYAANWGAGTNWLLGTFYLPSNPGLKFSSDGRYLAYAASPDRRPGRTNQIYLYDFVNGTNLLISQSSISLGPANAGSDSPDISADGRFIAYRSSASDIVPGDNNGVPDIFLYDRLGGATTLVSASRFGSHSADNRSLTPIFESNGQTLLFESWASDLVSADFNSNSDVFAFNLTSAGPVVEFSVAIVPSPQGSWITWPLSPGKTCRVQYKNDLSDSAWKELNGNVTIMGNTGYAKDLAPSAAQRFYRIVAF